MTTFSRCTSTAATTSPNGLDRSLATASVAAHSTKCVQLRLRRGTQFVSRAQLLPHNFERLVKVAATFPTVESEASFVGRRGMQTVFSKSAKRAQRLGTNHAGATSGRGGRDKLRAPGYHPSLRARPGLKDCHALCPIQIGRLKVFSGNEWFRETGETSRPRGGHVRCRDETDLSSSDPVLRAATAAKRPEPAAPAATSKGERESRRTAEATCLRKVRLRALCRIPIPTPAKRRESAQAPQDLALPSVPKEAGATHPTQY